MAGCYPATAAEFPGPEEILWHKPFTGNNMDRSGANQASDPSPVHLKQPAPTEAERVNASPGQFPPEEEVTPEKIIDIFKFHGF